MACCLLSGLSWCIVQYYMRCGYFCLSFAFHCSQSVAVSVRPRVWHCHSVLSVLVSILCCLLVILIALLVIALAEHDPFLQGGLSVQIL